MSPLFLPTPCFLLLAFKAVQASLYRFLRERRLPQTCFILTLGHVGEFLATYLNPIGQIGFFLITTTRSNQPEDKNQNKETHQGYNTVPNHRTHPI